MERTQVVSTTTDAGGEAGAREIARTLDAKLGGVRPAVVFVFASVQQPLAGLLPELARALPTSQILGASTAGQFTEQGVRKGAVSVLALAGDFHVTAGMAGELGKDPERAVAECLRGQPTQLHGYPYRTALLLLDPLAGNGEETTLLAASLLGEDVSLAGGAAGDDLAMRRTWVGAGSNVASDSVVVAQIFSKHPLGVGISHGHAAMSRPVTVTEAHGNVVRTLDGRPAWDVWRELTHDHAASQGIDVAKLGPDSVPGFLLQYEAGLTVGREIKVRAPLLVHADGSIGFACGMPKGSVFRVTESAPGRQVESAQAAARQARERLGRAEPAGAVVFDCVCRKLILGERFEEAVRGIARELGDVPLAGFETYGEIALNVGELSGFHNTTSVVLAFPR